MSRSAASSARHHRPCSEDDGYSLFNVERNGNFRIQVVLLPLFVHLRTRVYNSKIGLEAVELLASLRSDEHVGHEMLLPCQFMHESDALLRVEICPAISW